MLIAESNIMSEPLTWESTYDIALALKRAHPGIDMESVTLGNIQAWTLALPNFDDDPALGRASVHA